MMVWAAGRLRKGAGMAPGMLVQTQAQQPIGCPHKAKAVRNKGVAGRSREAEYLPTPGTHSKLRHLGGQGRVSPAAARGFGPDALHLHVHVCLTHAAVCMHARTQV